MAVRTIYSMADDCSRSERSGWQEFVRDYAPIAGTLLNRYFPMLAPELETHVTGVLQRARAGDNAWFRQIRFANEREFLMAFRDFVLAYGREVARIPTPELSLDQVADIMRNLAVVEREALWLFVKGYDAPQISAMLMNAETTVREVKQVADSRLREILPGASSDAFNVSGRVLMEAAEAARSDDCLSLKTFNNLINGQITWRERELAEQHIRDCMYCLERFTSFQEMIRIRHDAQPAPQTRVNSIVEQLGLAPTKHKGLLGKLFAR